MEAITEEEAVRLYRDLWRGTYRQFCYAFHLNESNFTRWLKGVKRNVANFKAVKLFLSLIQEMPTIETQDQLISYVHDQVITDVIRKIIIIDGDNSSRYVHSLQLGHSRDVFVIVALGAVGIEKRKVELLLPNLCYIRTFTRGVSNSADTLMIVYTTRLAAVLDLSIPFEIVSNDGFSVELSALVAEDGRSVQNLFISSDGTATSWEDR